jgi:DNA-binding transcriptional LysR family regulator
MARLRVITIVAEAEIADRLARDLKALGVRGWSLTHGEGHWNRALDTTGPADFDGPTVRFELVAREAMVEAVLAHLAAAWFPRYAVFAWMSEAEVLRPAKYD